MKVIHQPGVRRTCPTRHSVTESGGKAFTVRTTPQPEAGMIIRRSPVMPLVHPARGGGNRAPRMIGGQARTSGKLPRDHTRAKPMPAKSCLSLLPTSEPGIRQHEIYLDRLIKGPRRVSSASAGDPGPAHRAGPAGCPHSRRSGTCTGHRARLRERWNRELG